MNELQSLIKQLRNEEVKKKGRKYVRNKHAAERVKERHKISFSPEQIKQIEILIKNNRAEFLAAKRGGVKVYKVFYKRNYHYVYVKNEHILTFLPKNNMYNNPFLKNLLYKPFRTRSTKPEVLSFNQDKIEVWTVSFAGSIIYSKIKIQTR
jgi:hypothetical protein